MNSIKNILVTGNGFDLYHGLKTGYRDFIGRVEAAFAKEPGERCDLDVKLTEHCNVNGFFRHFHFLMADDLSWTFFESEMETIAGALMRFQDVVSEKQRDPEFDLIEFNIIPGLFTYQDLQICRHFARIFEQVVEDPSGGMFKLRQLFITQDRTLNKKAMVEEVQRELDDFTAALNLYLTACVEECEGQSDDSPADEKCLGYIPAFKQDIPDYVINFNYTDTVKRYGVPEEHIYFAKGRAGSDPVNLVLGCPARRPAPPMHPGPGGPPMQHMPHRPEDGPEPCGAEGPGGPPMPMPFPPGGPGGPGHHADWLFMENDFQKLTKGIGLPDREVLFPGEGASESVTVSYFGYSFPMGDAGLLAALWMSAKKHIVYYNNREDYAHKLTALCRLFGKAAVTDAIYREKLVFETVQSPLS